jgi:hypothetical protein
MTTIQNKRQSRLACLREARGWEQGVSSGAVRFPPQEAQAHQAGAQEP